MSGLRSKRSLGGSCRAWFPIASDPRGHAQYRTLAAREHTAFAGFNAGGLVAFYLGWDFPATFGRVGVQSIGV